MQVVLAAQRRTVRIMGGDNRTQGKATGGVNGSILSVGFIPLVWV